MRDVRVPIAGGGILWPLDGEVGGVARGGQRREGPRVQLVRQRIAQVVVPQGLGRRPVHGAQLARPVRRASQSRSAAECRSATPPSSAAKGRFTLRPRTVAGLASIARAQRRTFSYSWTERNSAAS